MVKLIAFAAGGGSLAGAVVAVTSGPQWQTPFFAVISAIGFSVAGIAAYLER